MDASAATLLNMLNVSPFTYGLIVEKVYDSGTVFDPQILDIQPEDLLQRFMEVIGDSRTIHGRLCKINFLRNREYVTSPAFL